MRQAHPRDQQILVDFLGIYGMFRTPTPYSPCLTSDGDLYPLTSAETLPYNQILSLTKINGTKREAA